MTDKSQTLQKRPIEQLQAGNAFRDALVPRCDRLIASTPLWHGWAIMDAFLAGIDYASALDAKDTEIAKRRHHQAQSREEGDSACEQSPPPNSSMSGK